MAVFRSFLRFGVIAASCFAVSLPAYSSPQDYFSGNMIEVMGANLSAVGSGFLAGRPFFRVRIGVRTLAGRIEYKDFIIGSDGLVQWLHQEEWIHNTITAQLLTLGASEVLWRRGHIGLAFEGVTIGDDLDAGYTDLLRTGFSAILNVLVTSAARVDFRSGYRYERTTYGLSEQETNHLLTESFLFRWNRPHGSGNVRAALALPTDELFNADQYRFSAGADNQAKWLSRRGMMLAAGVDINYDRNPLNEVYGLARDNLTATVHFDVSWIGNLGQ